MKIQKTITVSVDFEMYSDQGYQKESAKLIDVANEVMSKENIEAHLKSDCVRKLFKSGKYVIGAINKWEVKVESGDKMLAINRRNCAKYLREYGAIGVSDGTIINHSIAGLIFTAPELNDEWIPINYKETLRRIKETYRNR